MFTKHPMCAMWRAFRFSLCDENWPLSRCNVTHSPRGVNGFVVWAETIKQAPAWRTQPVGFLPVKS